MPKRPRSHALETDSRRAFATLLPSEWVTRPLISEYGLDEEVEVFGSKGSTTGLMFFIQMKATDKRDLAQALKLRFKVSTLDYYRSLELPVMIVRFHSHTRKFYWRWFHEFKESPKAGQKTLTLILPTSAEWNEKSPERVKLSLQFFRQLKSAICPRPIVFSLVLPDPEVAGTPASIFRNILLEEARPLRAVLEITESESLGAHPRILLSKDRLVVDLAGLKSITLDLGNRYENEAARRRLAHDVLTSIAFVLAKSGHFNEASEIASGHLHQGRLIGVPEVFFTLITAMAKSSRVNDALRLARDLLSQAQVQQLAPWLLIHAIAHSQCLKTPELEFLQEVMEMVLQRATELGYRQSIAVAHYNLGNHFRGRGAPHRKLAFRHYRLAAKMDPGYRQRPYFWKEVAGLLHVTGHFRWSADAYRRAIQLGGENICLALYADSLMQDAKFKDALNAFRQYMEKELKPDAEWLLKDFMLSYVVENLTITEQQHSSHGPNKLTDPSGLSDEQERSSLLEAIRLDALCSFAWFNLGASFARSGADPEAFRAYLFAGISRPQDVEAWCRALLHCLSSIRKDPMNASLLICIARMAYRCNGQQFLAKLEQMVAQQPPGFPHIELMNLVADSVKDIDRLNRFTEIRILGEGPNYKVIWRAEEPT
jgi:hypothetical protein